MSGLRAYRKEVRDTGNLKESKITIKQSLPGTLPVIDSLTP
jgi:hypothetical protein